MQTLRATRHHLREGSTGAEIISAMLNVVLSSTWLTGQASSSSLFVLLNGVPGGVVFLLILGVVHLIALTQPDTVRWIAVRKVCASVGLAVWISLIYDLLQRGATATVILVLSIALPLALSIVRRKYVIT